MIRIFTLFAVLALAGCGVQGGVPTRETLVTPFDGAQMAYAAAPGIGTVIGQAYTPKVGGGTHVASIQKVLLIPRTGYTEEFMSKFQGDYNRNVDFINLDQRMQSFVRWTISDQGGAFQFVSVPDGRYYAATIVTERIPALVAGYNERPRVLVGTVTVKGVGPAKVAF